MNKAKIVLCDTDTSYRLRLHGYLNEHLQLPVSIVEYSDPAQMCQNENGEEIALCITDEISATALPDAFCSHLLVLTENGAEETRRLEGEVRFYRSRYQKATHTAALVLEILSKDARFLWQETGKKERTTRIIGYYSPLGRCMQTSMALATGMALAEKKRTLYLGFASYAGKELKRKEGDLADLMYYHDCARERLVVFIEKIKGQIGGLEYIPPAEHFLKTEGVTGEDWVRLILALAKETDAGYLLLDLSDTVQGLFTILSVCDEIYTITGHDARDRDKIDAYRKFLVMQEEERILQKTRFCTLPKGCPLPERARALSSGALASHLWREKLIPSERYGT